MKVRRNGMESIDLVDVQFVFGCVLAEAMSEWMVPTVSSHRYYHLLSATPHTTGKAVMYESSYARISRKSTKYCNRSVIDQYDDNNRNKYIKNSLAIIVFNLI